jgi:hypothetical protein
MAGIPGGGVAAGDARVFDSEARKTMRGVLLWALGIPIPVVILLYVFHVI